LPTSSAVGLALYFSAAFHQVHKHLGLVEQQAIIYHCIPHLFDPEEIAGSSRFMA